METCWPYGLLRLSAIKYFFIRNNIYFVNDFQYGNMISIKNDERIKITETYYTWLIVDLL